jgi:hypothetical protein
VEPDKLEGKTGEPDKPEVKSASAPLYDAAPSETTANTSPDMTRRNIILGSIIGGSILVLGLIYLVFLRNGSEIIVAEKPIEEVIEDNQQRYVDEESGLDTAGGGQMISPDSISLTILSEDTTWIRIIFDENRSEEFILFPNSQKIVRTKNNYKITIGNPSGIKFQLNNKPLNFTWGKGTVASILIDSSGLQYLKTVPVRKQPAVEVDSSNIQ